MPATNTRYQVKALFSVSQLTCRCDHECSPRPSRGHRSRSPFSYRAVTTGQNCTPSDNIGLMFQARYPESHRREIARGETSRKGEEARALVRAVRASGPNFAEIPTRFDRAILVDLPVRLPATYCPRMYPHEFPPNKHANLPHSCAQCG